jgi:hypothetical protein
MDERTQVVFGDKYGDDAGMYFYHGEAWIQTHKTNKPPEINSV